METTLRHLIAAMAFVYLKKTIYNFETIELKKLITYGVAYPPKVRALLGAILEAMNVDTANLSLLKKLESNIKLSSSEYKDLENLPSTLMICYLNGFEDAKQKLIDAKLLLKPFPTIYLSFKESLRILRKMKYDVQ